MDELRRTQSESTMAQDEFSRSITDMDYSQVVLSRLCVQNEMSQPPQEEVSSLETTIAELRRVQVYLATSQAQFMEEVYTPPQEELNVNNGVDELAFTMAKLTNCGVDLSINEEMTPMACNTPNYALVVL